MKRSILLSAVALAGCSALVSPAFAATTGDISVTLDVTASCSLDVGDLAFPSVGTVTTGADVSGTADVTVECTDGIPYKIGLDYGDHPEEEQRQLQNDGATNEFLTYGLYTDAGHSTAWGNDQVSVEGSAVAFSGVGTGAVDTTQKIYGIVDPDQPVSVGSYSDTVTATIWYGGTLTP